MEASWGQSDLDLDDEIRASEQKEEKDRVDFELWITNKLSASDNDSGDADRGGDFAAGRKKKQLQTIIKFVRAREKLARLNEELEALHEKDASQGPGLCPCE